MGEAARLIEVDFGAEVEEAPKPAFGSAAWYAAFRAEFVRLKSMSVYERMAEKDEQTAARRQMQRKADMHGSVPIWAWYQRHWGITQTIHIWQAETRYDRDRGRTLVGDGLLERVRGYAVEPAALANIEAESAIWCATGGRTWLTSDEHRALILEKRYLRDNGRLGKWAQCVERRKGGPVAETLLLGWVGEQMGRSAKQVKHLLQSVEHVYALRAQIGVDGEPAVRLAAPRRAEIGALSGEADEVAA